MSVEDQVRIVKDYDVILERCYAQNMGGGKYKSNLPSNVEIIKEVGYQNVMVDTRRRPDGKSPLGAGHGGVHAVSGGAWDPGGARIPYDTDHSVPSAGTGGLRYRI